MYVDRRGTYHYSEEDAKKANGKYEEQGAALGGLIGLFLFLVMIVPVIVSKLVGTIIGHCLKIGLAGKIITTTLFILVFWVFFDILIAMRTQGTLRYMLTAIGLLLSLFVGLFWFWRKHYNVIKDIPISEFSRIFKNSFAILYWGGIGLWIIFGVVDAYNATRSGVIYSNDLSIFATPLVLSVIYWLRKTRKYLIASDVDSNL